jgi:hypothetical protein
MVCRANALANALQGRGQELLGRLGLAESDFASEAGSVDDRSRVLV